MIPVARGAAWRGKIPAFGQCLPVNALPVVRKLVRGNLVLGHVLRVGMAPRTGLRQPQRMDRGKRIFDRADAVCAMAVRADRNGGVALRKPLAVNAGHVLRVLIHSLAGVVFVHEGGVAMTPCAQFGDGRSRGLGNKAASAAHGHGGILGGRIPTVAGRTTETVLDVDVIPGFFGGLLKVPSRGQMAFHAGVPGGEERSGGSA